MGFSKLYPNGFVIELRALSKKKQFLFGLCNSERLLHFYESFEEEWEVKQPFATLLSNLELGYRCVIEENRVTIQELAQAMGEVEKAIPDNDEYDGSILVTYAQNASLALYCTFKYAVKEKDASLLEACEKTIDTIDSITLGQSADNNVDTQAAIDQEIALQLDYLKYISSIDLTEENVASLRRLNQGNRVLI